jgi:AcrR family transcriptional regulator
MATASASVMGADRPGRRRRQPPEVRRDQVIRATLEAITAFGVAGATTSQIARIAGVSQGTLYLHFANREAMLEAAVRSILDQQLALIAGATDADPVERIRSIARLHGEMVVEQAGGYSTPWHLIIAASRHTTIQDAVTAAHWEGFRVLRDVVEEAKVVGRMRQDVDSDELVWGMLSYAWTQETAYLVGADPMAAARALERMLDALINSALQHT